jgi:hypothetical protein
MYLAWATSKWGNTTGSVVQRSVPRERMTRTARASRISLSMPVAPIPRGIIRPAIAGSSSCRTSGAPEYRYPQITAHLRTDDPDLRVLVQTSQDLSFWFPLASSVDLDLFSK